MFFCSSFLRFVDFWVGRLCWSLFGLLYLFLVSFFDAPQGLSGFFTCKVLIRSLAHFALVQTRITRAQTAAR